MKSREKLEEFLKEIEREIGELPKDLHVTRMCCALVAFSQGEIIKVEKRRLKYCPLRVGDKLYRFKDLIKRRFVKLSGLRYQGSVTSRRIGS